MKEHLHLFTDLKDRKPEDKTQGFAYRHDRVYAGMFITHRGTPIIDVGGGVFCEYTHWLDLSALTTKKRAIEAFNEGKKNNYECIADGVTKICYCKKEIECQHRKYKTAKDLEL